LDDEQGAGRVDAVDAYTLYSRAASSATPYANWALTSLKRYKTYAMNLGNLKAGQELDATAVWNYHVARKDNGNRIVDAGDKFYESLPLANFILTLLKDGNIVANSDSRYDNLEHLAFRISQPGNYTLTVYLREEGGGKNETFAVAARVLGTSSVQQTLMASSKYDAMTGGGVMRSVDEASLAGGSVPEPSAVAMVAGAAILSCCGRRRRV
jgi:hypothetical protein